MLRVKDIQLFTTYKVLLEVLKDPDSSVDKEYTDQLDLVDIGNEFIRESHHREKVFGTFFEIRYYLNSLVVICVQYVNFCGCGFWE